MKPENIFNPLTSFTIVVLLTVLTVIVGFREPDLELQPENPISNQTLLSLEKIDSTQWVHASADSLYGTPRKQN